MNQKLLRAGLALVTAIGIPVLGRGQTTPTPAAASPAPSPGPDWIMTPGAGLNPESRKTSGDSTPPAPSTTSARSGSDLYTIPRTTPVGMPQYSITGSPAAGGIGTGTADRGRPMTGSDCGKGGWRNFPALGFNSQKSCESWVRQHAARTSGARASRTPGTPTTLRETTPRARRTRAPEAPPTSGTPGSSITPLLKPTPAPR